MQSINAVNLMDDPLAGCLPVMQMVTNAETFLRSVMLRMRLFYSEDTCQKICDRIIEESKQTVLYQYEYVINEILFEFNEAKRNLQPFEPQLSLQAWITDIIARYGQDTGIEFFKYVKTNRINR